METEPKFNSEAWWEIEYERRRLEANRKRRLYNQRPEVKERNRLNRIAKRSKLPEKKPYTIFPEFNVPRTNYKRGSPEAIVKRLATSHRRRTEGYGVRIKGHPLALLGCSIEEMVVYIENQFTDEMSWDNYGKNWNFDHIYSLAEFDLNYEISQMFAFHYTNVKAVNIVENIKKSNIPPDYFEVMKLEDVERRLISELHKVKEMSGFMASTPCKKLPIELGNKVKKLERKIAAQKKTIEKQMSVYKEYEKAKGSDQPRELSEISLLKLIQSRGIGPQKFIFPCLSAANDATSAKERNLA